MTAQFPEKLVENGVARSLCSEPLRPYLESLAEVPSFREKGYTTALWRGYVGRWEVREGRLFLIGLTDFEGDTLDESRIFEVERLPIHATWYTGRLRVMSGKLLRYVHQYWASEYQTERVIRIREGIAAGEFVIDHVARIRGEIEEDMARHRSSLNEAAEGLTDDALELAGFPRRAPKPLDDEEDEDGDSYVIAARYVSRGPPVPDGN